MTTGHTHNEQDQRFGTAGQTLNRAEELEDMEDFRYHLQTYLPQTAGRTIHVEILHGTWDFKQWFDQLGVTFAGIAATQSEPNTCHALKIARRSIVDAMYGPGVYDEKGIGMEKHANDAILLCRQYMHSEVLAQPPIEILSVLEAAKLDPSALLPAPRITLGSETIKDAEQQITKQRHTHMSTWMNKRST